MIKAAERLQEILQTVPSVLLGYSEEEASRIPAPGKWSKKELLGHLIDSAANNHQRFVRMQIENNIHLPQYQQNEWVSVQNYQARLWTEIINIWFNYNQHLMHVLKHVNQEKLSNTAVFPEYGTKSLQWLIDDYIDHMEHHFKQLLQPVSI